MQTLENLKIAKEILDDIGIIFWLEAGTLLLAYRDGKVDETDIDISVYGCDISAVLANLELFFERGFSVSHIYSHPSGLGTEITLVRNGVRMDIWGKWFRDGQVWWLAYSTDYIPQHVDEKHCKTLDKLEIWGETWNIPHDVEGYLEANYGDWKTPNQNWRWNIDPVSIDYNWEISDGKS